jgi:hypothetical protein
MIPRLTSRRSLEAVSTLIPSDTGVVQEAGVPGIGLYCPSGVLVSAVITHMRQAPNDFIPG